MKKYIEQKARIIFCTNAAELFAISCTHNTLIQHFFVVLTGRVLINYYFFDFLETETQTIESIISKKKKNNNIQLIHLSLSSAHKADRHQTNFETDYFNKIM